MTLFAQNVSVLTRLSFISIVWKFSYTLRLHRKCTAVKICPTGIGHTVSKPNRQKTHLQNKWFRLNFKFLGAWLLVVNLAGWQYIVNLQCVPYGSGWLCLLITERLITFPHFWRRRSAWYFPTFWFLRKIFDSVTGDFSP